MKADYFFAIAFALFISFATVSVTSTASTTIASSPAMAAKRTNVVVPASTAANTKSEYLAPLVPS